MPLSPSNTNVIDENRLVEAIFDYCRSLGYRHWSIEKTEHGTLKCKCRDDSNRVFFGEGTSMVQAALRAALSCEERQQQYKDYFKV